MSAKHCCPTSGWRMEGTPTRAARQQGRTKGSDCVALSSPCPQLWRQQREPGRHCVTSAATPAAHQPTAPCRRCTFQKPSAHPTAQAKWKPHPTTRRTSVRQGPDAEEGAQHAAGLKAAPILCVGKAVGQAGGKKQPAGPVQGMQMAFWQATRSANNCATMHFTPTPALHHPTCHCGSQAGSCVSATASGLQAAMRCRMPSGAE